MPGRHAEDGQTHTRAFLTGPVMFCAACELSCQSNEVNGLTFCIEHLLFWLLRYGEKMGWTPAKLTRNVMSFSFLKARPSGRRNPASRP